MTPDLMKRLNRGGPVLAPGAFDAHAVVENLRSRIQYPTPAK